MYRRSFRRINFFLSPPVGAGAGTYVWNIVFLMQGVRVFVWNSRLFLKVLLSRYLQPLKLLKLIIKHFWDESRSQGHTLILDQHPDFWPNLDPDLDTIFFKKTYFLKPLYKKIMSPEEIFSQLNMVNVPVRYVFNLSCFDSNLSHIYLSGSGFVMRFRIRNTDPIWIRIYNTVRKHCWAPSNFAFGNNKTT